MLQVGELLQPFAFDAWPRSGWKGTFLTALAIELIQICLQGILTHRRIGGVVVGIESFVLPACADLACLTSQMFLGGTPFERSQETIRLAARPVQQRCRIPRGVGVLVRALGGGDKGQARLLLAVALCSILGVCALVGLADELQVSSTPLLRA